MQSGSSHKRPCANFADLPCLKDMFDAGRACYRVHIRAPFDKRKYRPLLSVHSINSSRAGRIQVLPEPSSSSCRACGSLSVASLRQIFVMVEVAFHGGMKAAIEPSTLSQPREVCWYCNRVTDKAPIQQRPKSGFARRDYAELFCTAAVMVIELPPDTCVAPSET